jgi:hypothetical protein
VTSEDEGSAGAQGRRAETGNDRGYWLNFVEFERSVVDFRLALRNVEGPVASLAKADPVMQEIRRILGSLNVTMAALSEVRRELRLPGGLAEKFAGVWTPDDDKDRDQGPQEQNGIAGRGLLLVPDGAVSIVIHGQFDRPGDEIGEIIDNALHDAGLCGCAGPANGYMLTVETSATADRQGPSKDHDRLEAARARIRGAVAAGQSEQGGEGRSAASG